MVTRNFNHSSYEKMPESLDYWQLSESDYRKLRKTPWVVTEKIHGANFCIITDGTKVGFAKRKELLSPDEDFFGFHSIRKLLREQTLSIYHTLHHNDSSIVTVAIYGELFGGEYPHPEVMEIEGFQGIQTGVYYSPKICYCAFDIALECGAPKGRVYLDYDLGLKLFRDVGMFYSQSLFMGKYEDALAYNIKFNSTIPGLLGLPKLPRDNLAEGVVIKPAKAIYLDTPKGKVRPIFKRKINLFAEDSRFHQAEKWSYSYYKPRETDINEQLLSLVTPTRLDNVISKLGRVVINNPSKKKLLVESFIDDVLESFREIYPTQWETFSSSYQDKLKKNVLEAVLKLLEKKP